SPMNWRDCSGTDGKASKQESRARRLKPRFWWTEGDSRWRRLLGLGKSGRPRPFRPKTGRRPESGFCRLEHDASKEIHYTIQPIIFRRDIDIGAVPLCAGCGAAS